MSWLSEAFSWVPNEIWRGLRAALDGVAASYGIPLSDLRAYARQLHEEHPDWSDEQVMEEINRNPEQAVMASHTSVLPDVDLGDPKVLMLIGLAAVLLLRR